MADPGPGAAPLCVDAYGFLGMHHPQARVRRDWKSFFVRNLDRPLLMNLEQVGVCDDLVWGTPREVQDAYYPFMDVLHTVAAVRRLPYTEADLNAATTEPDLDGLPVTQRLLVAFTRRHGALLTTRDPELLARTGLPVRRVPRGDEHDVFPGDLERAYQESLVLSLAPRGARLSGAVAS